MNATLCLFLALVQNDEYGKLKLGQRVEITFRHGATVSGTLVARDPKVDAVDYSREAALTIDMSREYSALPGTLSVPKDQIREVRRLQALDPKTEEQVRQERLKAEEDERKRQEDKTRRANEGKIVISCPPPPVSDMEREEKLKKSRELRAKFPPSEWSLEMVTEAVRRRALNRLRPTPEQREFLENYPLWMLAEQVDKSKKAPKDAAPADRKP